MNTTPLCPKCGKPLEAGAPKGLCPACLMQAAFPTGTEADGKSPRFVPPAIAELAPKFPQLEILEFIGQGGMGAVYKARQKELDRVVALKILPPDIGQDAAFADRFTREARALAKLNHPGIVTIHDFGRADGLYFFLMEFVDGVNLRQLLNAGRISTREALAIVPQICDALQFAHDQGIVHRDIKPENILLDRRGRVKVADFGLAKIMGGQISEPNIAGGVSASSTAVTDVSMVMGTPQYMSPEQVHAPGEVDHRADIYALGVVFYQMLTGELPGKPLEPPSHKVHIDVRLDAVVLRALEKMPELRYQQVSDVKTMVETIATTPAPFSPAASQSWQSPDSGWGWLVGKMFGTTFTSPLAYQCANLSALGFLGFLACLGFLPFPGSHVCFGLSGFSGLFGLIGLAQIIELSHRRKVKQMTDRPPATPEGKSGSSVSEQPHFWRSIIMVVMWVAIIVIPVTVVLLTIKSHYTASVIILTQSEFLDKFQSNKIAQATITLGGQSSQLTPVTGTYFKTDKNGKVTTVEVPFAVPNAYLTQNTLDKLLASDKIEVSVPKNSLTIVVWAVAPFIILGVGTLLFTLILAFIIRRVWRAVNKGSTVVQSADASSSRREEAHTDKSKTAPNVEPDDLNRIRRQIFGAGGFLALMAFGMGINVTPFQPCGVAIVAWGVLLSVVAAAVASTAGNSLMKLKLAGSIALFNSLGLFSAVILLALDCPWMRRTNSHILIIAASAGAIVYSLKKLFDTWSSQNNIPSAPQAAPQVPSAGKSDAVPDEAGSKTGGGWRVLLSIVVQIAAAVPLLAFMTSIVPKFEVMARDFGTHLPAVTGFAVNATNFAGRYLWLWSVIAILLSWAMHRWGGRKWLWRWTAGVAAVVIAWFVVMVAVVVIPMMIYGPQVIHRNPARVPEILTPPAADQARPKITTDQVIVEDLALQMLVAIREKDDNKLKSFATDRIKGWSEALPAFAVEMREHYRQLTGNELFDLRAVESLVAGNLAAVKCTGPKELNGIYLVLFFVKTDDGWRNHSLRNSPPGMSLAQHFANFKKEIENEENAAAAASAKGATSLAEAIRAFNARAKGDVIGKDQSPLTEDEVIAAIRWSLLEKDKLPVSDKTRQALSRVIEMRELPPGFELEVLTDFIPDSRMEVTKWSVRLRIPAEPNGTTCVSIREVNLGSRTIGPHERAFLERSRTNWSTVPVIGAPSREDERKAAIEQDKAERELSFGPVKECVLNDLNVINQNVAIRFKTGELLSLPPVDRLGQQRWMLTNGAAMLTTKETGYWILIAGGLRLGDFPREHWDKADSTEVAESLLHGTTLRHPEAIELADVSYLLPSPLTTPFVLSFQTSEGSMGLLQILSFTGNPPGVKLRYKLVQNGDSSAETGAQIFAIQPPVVVETFPASGARDVEPGETEIRVRFSKEMTEGSWSWSTAWENSTPEFIGQPYYEADARTCVVKVKLEPGRTYAFWLNSENFKNFKDSAGRPAIPYLLIFQTKPN